MDLKEKIYNELKIILEDTINNPIAIEEDLNFENSRFDLSFVESLLKKRFEELSNKFDNVDYLNSCDEVFLKDKISDLILKNNKEIKSYCENKELDVDEYEELLNDFLNDKAIDDGLNNGFYYLDLKLKGKYSFVNTENELVRHLGELDVYYPKLESNLFKILKVLNINTERFVDEYCNRMFQLCDSGDYASIEEDHLFNEIGRILFQDANKINKNNFKKHLLSLVKEKTKYFGLFVENKTSSVNNLESFFDLIFSQESYDCIALNIGFTVKGEDLQKYSNSRQNNIFSNNNFSFDGFLFSNDLDAEIPISNCNYNEFLGEFKISQNESFKDGFFGNCLGKELSKKYDKLFLSIGRLIELLESKDLSLVKEKIKIFEEECINADNKELLSIIGFDLFDFLDFFKEDIKLEENRDYLKNLQNKCKKPAEEFLSKEIKKIKNLKTDEDLNFYIKDILLDNHLSFKMKEKILNEINTVNFIVERGNFLTEFLEYKKDITDKEYDLLKIIINKTEGIFNKTTFGNDCLIRLLSEYPQDKYIELIKLLVEHKDFNPDFENNGSYLHSTKNINMAKLLVKNKVNPNIVDKFGKYATDSFALKDISLEELNKLYLEVVLNNKNLNNKKIKV